MIQALSIDVVLPAKEGFTNNKTSTNIGGLARRLLFMGCEIESRYCLTFNVIFVP